MGEVVEFRLKRRPTRDQAKQWLSANVGGFPVDLEGHIGPDLFHGWRFVLGLDDVVYFANCLDAGITEQEINSSEHCA